MISGYKIENEAILVQQAKTDNKAFEILYNHYFPKIYGYIFKRVGDHHDTEDLVSKIFLKVFSNLDKYKDQGYNFSSWLYKIATNILIDYYRKNSKKFTVDIEEVDIVDSKPTPDVMVQSLQDAEIVREVLSELPERYQEVINMKFFAEMSNDEMAEVLNISVNNTRVLAHRAMINFQKIYGKYGK